MYYQSVLTACLSLWMLQEPSALDKAIAAHFAAIEATPAFTISYKMHKESAEQKTDAVLTRWHDGPNSRFIATVNGEKSISSYTIGPRSLMIIPPQKIYSDDVIDPANKKKEHPKVSAENNLNFAFSGELEFYFESNPPLQVVGEEIDRRDGIEVKRIAFEAKKPDGSGSIKGTSEFDTKVGYLVRLDFEVFGTYPGKMSITREKFETTAPPASTFVIDPSDYAGFQKVDAIQS